MKKTLIFSVLLIAIAAVPVSAHAQLSVFGFKATGKASITAPAAPQVQPAPAVSADATANATSDDNDTDDLTVSEIQSQPLSVRRQMVASQLGDILLKLNVLSDKTKAAADRLAQNGIGTGDAQTHLSAAILTLAQAKLSIDTLTTVANDPKNEAVSNLMIDGETFKDAVIKAEDMLRTGRQSIIDSLVSLKASVSATATAQ